MASTRTWTRIRQEFSAGASVAWLSVRHGPAERTIGARAAKEGWRRKDLALLADQAWDEAARAEGAGPTGGPGGGPGGAGADPMEPGDAGVGDAGVGEVDLAQALKKAQAWALRALEAGDARAAQDFLKVARMLAGDAEGPVDACGEEARADAEGQERGRQAALAFLRREGLAN